MLMPELNLGEELVGQISWNIVISVIKDARIQFP
jgi:hypothetical protein